MRLSTVMTAAMIGLAGCGGGDDRVDAVLALSGDPANGQTKFVEHCAECHKEDATGGSGPNLVGHADPEGFVTQVIDGGETMPPFGDALSDQEIADIHAWIESL
jgi:mono/diheme cytochrome c family protein